MTWGSGQWIVLVIVIFALVALGWDVWRSLPKEGDDD